MDVGVTVGLASLARACAGEVVVGADEPLFLLLTADAEAWPRHCALSRHEVRVRGEEVHVALLARRTSADIERDGRAVLLIVEGGGILTCRLERRRLVRRGAVLAAAWRVVGAESDSAGVAVRPPTFSADASLVRSERWADTAAALDALGTPGGATGGRG